MNRIVVTLLTIVLLVSMVSCSGDKTGTDTGYSLYTVDDSGWPKGLPDYVPVFPYGVPSTNHHERNTEDGAHVYIKFFDDVTKEEYTEYTQSLLKAGFTDPAVLDEDGMLTYVATYNSGGNELATANIVWDSKEATCSVAYIINEE